VNTQEHRSKRVARSLLSFGDRLRWVLVPLLVYLAVVYTLLPVFFSPSNLWALVYYTCLLVPAVVGVHLLIVLGLFDLSVGAVAAASGVIAARAMHAGLAIPISLAIGTAIGLIFGLLNWLFVVKFQISALIATLISLGIARAVSLGITEGQSIGGLPSAFAEIALGSPGSSISPAIMIGIGLVCFVEFLTQRHILFRRFYHVGSNPAAAASSGISVSSVQLFGFILSGVGAAVVGLLQCSRTLSASPFLFPDLALECIAASIIGGASLSGGSGTVVGASFGMLMIVISRNLVVMAGINVYWQELGIALILLAAVLLRSGERRSAL
jgi:ribose transport system permease protein